MISRSSFPKFEFLCSLGNPERPSAIDLSAHPRGRVAKAGSQILAPRREELVSRFRGNERQRDSRSFMESIVWELR